MAGITLAIAEAQLALAITSYEKALKANSYSLSGSQTAFSKSNQDIKKMLENIQYWDEKIQDLSSTNSGLILSQIAPTDDR